MSRGRLRQCLTVCRRRRYLPSWSVGKAVQLFASGRIAIQMMVYGRSQGCSRSGKIRTPQRRAIGTEKSLCRQGATQGVAPTFLTCPTGFPYRVRCPTLSNRFPRVAFRVGFFSREIAQLSALESRRCRRSHRWSEDDPLARRTAAEVLV